MVTDKEIYDLCIQTAEESPCQKLGFGAVLCETHGEDHRLVISQAFNSPLDVLRHVCDPECARFKIRSRTESMLGACQHAEEKLLEYARSMDWQLRFCEIFVAGVRPDGALLTKEEATFTCIRCAVQMYAAGLKAINVWMEDKWHRIDTADAVTQAYEYATGKEPDSA